MSFLAWTRKHDLKVLAKALGLTVRPEFKIAQLHKLVTESPVYDEEFTRELLAAIREGRERKEECEKEERERKRENKRVEREECKREEREKERESEERERKEHKRVEREKECEREIKEERDREEREKEHEREERIRAFELQKLQLEAMAARAQPVETTQLPEQPLKIRIHNVKPRFNPKEDEISLFLLLFEHQAKIMNISAQNQVTQLISLLPHDIVQPIAIE
ncbi:Reticulocyte-binding protein 2-like protein a, partial [Stegodyphus mimosarum]